jgi:hypothetical protein
MTNSSCEYHHAIKPCLTASSSLKPSDALHLHPKMDILSGNPNRIVQHLEIERRVHASTMCTPERQEPLIRYSTQGEIRLI